MNTWTIVLQTPKNYDRADYLATMDILLGKYSIIKKSFRLSDGKLYIYVTGDIDEMRKITNDWLLCVDKISKKVDCSFIKK